MSPRETPGENPQWKDFINRKLLERIAATVAGIDSSFNPKKFVDAVVADRLEERELKDRINTAARHFAEALPSDYPKAVKIVIKTASELRGFGNWILTAFVESYGLDHFDDSVRALRELTKYGSSEFAIRPYIIRYTDRMLKVLDEWTEDPNEHVRRLAAEGCRPRGVWTMHIEAFKKDPRPVIKILEKLNADESLYVRKAVANNLNDISKDHPDLAIKTALAWKKNGNKHTDWIVKHACRSLIKQGHPEVFGIFGYTSSPKVEVRNFLAKQKSVKIGGEATLQAELVSKAKSEQRLVIDYRVHYLKKNNKVSAKVFKLTEKTFKPGENQTITTRHSFAERSTRSHNPGTHKIELIINGKPKAMIEVNLRK